MTHCRCGRPTDPEEVECPRCGRTLFSALQQLSAVQQLGMDLPIWQGDPECPCSGWDIVGPECACCGYRRRWNAEEERDQLDVGSRRWRSTSLAQDRRRDQRIGGQPLSGGPASTAEGVPVATDGAGCGCGSILLWVLGGLIAFFAFCGS